MFNGGFRGRRANDNTGSLNPQAKYLQDKSPQPSIVSWSIVGSDDTALAPAGGQPVLVTGTGFTSGSAVTLNGQTISPVTILSSTQLTFTSPALSGGSYTLIIYNTSGAAAILVPGVTYSSVPTYSTAAGSIGTYYETTSVNTSVVATSDSALTYALSSGSLPSGATLFANGVIRGTAPVSSGSSTYTFSITATDAELQDVTRTFTLTINTDVVTWVTPASGSTITLDGSVYSQALTATDAAGYSVSYTANTLPTGLTLAAGTISGTPTVESTVNTLLTATAATTGRSAANTITWIVSLADVYFKYVSLLLSGNGSIITTSFSNDASTNNAQLTVVGDTRAQNFNPFSEGNYSVLFPATGSYLTGTTTFNPTSQTRAWTFECWIYPLTNSNFFAIGNGSPYGNGFYIIWGSGTANKFTFGQGNGSSNPVSVTSTGTYYSGQWYHFAITNDTAGVRRLFVNGILDGTQTYTAGTLSSATTFVVNGVYDNNGLGNSGGSSYISNLRLIPDQTLYTANFIPATSSLTSVSGTNLLLCKTHRFIDVSPNNFAVTVAGLPGISPNNPFGNIAPTSVTVPGTNNYSMYFDGTGDYLNTPANAAFAFGTGDFTIECWIYLSVLGTYRRIWWFVGDNDNTNVNASNQIQFGGASQTAITGSTLVANTWYHLAYVRSSGSGKLYLDGVQVGSTTANAYNSVLRSIYIGATNTGADPWSGYISNFRVVNGQAVYTTNFAPSTTALTAIAPTGTVAYSTYFDGTGDNLTIPSNIALTLGNGEFTVEAWVYLSGTQTTTYGYQVIGTYPAGATPNGYALVVNRSSATAFGIGWANGTPTAYQLYYGSGGTYLNTGTWYHIAVVRTSTATNGLTIYLNGTAVATGTDATNDAVLQTLYIGSQGAGQYFPGYISNARITKQALYTSAFTPSTTPLTTTSQGATVANVVVLTCQSAGFVDNSRYGQVITRFGDATPSIVNPFYANATVYTSLLTAQNNTVVDNGILTTPVLVTGDARPSRASPFFGTTTQALTGTEGSAYFDGAGDYLTLSSQSYFSMGTGDFTIEMWVYIINLSTQRTLYDTMNQSDGTGTGRFGMQVSTGGVVQIYTTAGTVLTSGGTLVGGTWYHLAYSRFTNSGKLYVNGVQVNSTYTDNNNYVVGTTNRPIIGINAYDNSSSPMLGYISNLRVVKGTALYTSAFFPGFAPMTAVANTQLLTLQTRGSHNNSAFADNSTLGNVITRAGNVTNGTFSPYGNNFSTYFNGSTYFSLSNGGTLYGAIAGSLITIEFWVMTTAIQAVTAYNTGIFGQAPAAAQNGRYAINTVGTSTTSAQTVSFYYTTGTGSASSCTTTATITQNIWNHIAVTIDATTAATSTVKIYINGTGETFTNQNLSTHTADPGNTFQLGAANNSLQSLTGYLSNFRFTRGQLVYTGNFTPPTAPLTVLQAAGTNIDTITNGSYVKALMMQSNRFIDNSSYNNAPTIATGTPQVQKFSPFSSVTVTPYYSGSFNGSSDYLSTPATLAAAFGTGDYTVEYWIYAISFSNGPTVFDARASTSAVAAFSDNYSTSGAPGIYFNAGQLLTSSILISTNTWAHVAFVRSSGTTKVYVNGVQGASVADTNSYDISTSRVLNIGVNNTTSAKYFNGYISNLRVVKGLALYTGAFSVPTAPLAVTQTAGTNIVAMSGIPTNGNSVYLNGTTDYLSIPDSDAFYFGIGPFTIEGWFYLTGSGGRFYTQYVDGVNQIWGSMGTTGVVFQMNFGGSVLFTLTATTTLTLGIWYHIAIVRNSNTITIYVNGTSINSGSYSGSAPNIAGPLLISTYNGTAEFFPGYISNYRVVKGLALYTGAFTVPTAPLGLTQTAGTNIVAMTGVPTNGNSVFFNGTTDYLTVPSGSAAQTVLSGGDFTMECWVYLSSVPAAAGVLFASTVSSDGFVLRISTTPNVRWVIPGVAEYPFGPTLSTNTWYHVAVCRVSTVVTGYVNGTQYTFSSTNRTTNASTTLQMGNDLSQGTHYLPGYVSNARIVKGTALYTANFTPSTTPLSYVSGTVLLTCQATTFVDTGGGQTITRSGTPAISQTISPFGYSPVLLTCQPPQTTVIADNSLNNNAITIFGTARASRTTSPFGYSPSLLALQNNTFVDAALDNLTITAATTTVKPMAVSPFTPTATTSLAYNTSRFSGSMYFDGSGDYLSIPDSAALEPGSGNFTVEAWIYPVGSNAANGSVIFSKSNTSSYGPINIGFAIPANSNYLQALSSTNGSTWGIQSVSTKSFASMAYSWNHVAYVRNGSTFTLYLNGVNVATATSSSALVDNANSVMIGYVNYASTEFPGYISDVRYVVGAALYTANFFPGASPATPTYTIGTSAYSSALLVNGTAGGIVDNSRTVDIETVADAKVTQFGPYNGSYYSNYFDGTGDYLTLASNAAFSFGTNDFTVEGWVYLNAAKTQVLFDTRASGPSTTGIAFAFDASNNPFVYVNGATLFTSSTALSLNVWTHVAFVKSTGTITIYINGVKPSTGSGASATALTDQAATIGTVIDYRDATATYHLNGSISNLRITKGQALYTGNFTPSTTPLTTTSQSATAGNVSLLTCQSNKFVDNSSNAFTLTTSGTPTVQTQNPFALNSGISYYFDGTGDYLAMPENTSLWYFGAGDFTIETWLYLGATNSSTAYIIARSQHGVGSDWYFGTTSTNQIQFYMLTGGAGNIVTSTGTLVLNTWNHIAVARSGTTVRLFINGAIDGTLSSYTGVLTTSYGPTVISNASNNTGSHYLTGYVTDLRVTKGYARYTGAFTPPTAAVKAQ